jgi:hypothetical protein
MRSSRTDVEDQYIGPLQFSQEFGVHYMTALSIFRKADFPSVKVRGRWKVKRRSAHEYFKERTDGKTGNGNLPDR